MLLPKEFHDKHGYWKGEHGKRTDYSCTPAFHEEATGDADGCEPEFEDAVEVADDLQSFLSSFAKNLDEER